MTSQTVRQLKSLTQRILLLDFNSVGEKLEYTILGSTGKTYIVSLWYQDNIIHFCCNCLDYVHRQQPHPCKHVYWIGHKQFGNIDPKKWRIENLNMIVQMRSPIGRNDNCPICLEHINYEHENTICCIHQCNNSVHQICWNRYTVCSVNYNCVVCREPWW